MYNFTHYGKLGDIIYSLYVISQIGSGDLYITPAKCGGNLFNAIKPLLELQPYLTNVYYTKEPPCVNLIDLNLWRKVGYQEVYKDHIILNNCRSLLTNYNKNIKYPPSYAWLYNVEPMDIAQDYIVIHRSERYHAIFNYMDYVDPKMVLYFCGGKGEYDKFKAEYPQMNIEYYHTATILDFARMIKGSQYFIGNQSLGSALAQALWHPQIQETHRKETNCIPPDDLLYIARDK